MTEDIKPAGAVVKLDEGEYYKLRTRIMEADLAVARATAILAAKDALVKELAAKYGFDVSFTRWQADDDTTSFSFS